MSNARSARQGLLGRRGRQLRYSDGPQLSLEFGGIETFAGGEPVAGAQLEEALARPVRQDTEDVTEVGLGIEAVQARGGDQGEQVAGGLAVIVAADEQPVLAPYGDAAQLALGSVVVEFEPAVVVEPGERLALTNGVAESGAQEAALAANAFVLGFGPCEERVGVRAQVGVAAP